MTILSIQNVSIKRGNNLIVKNVSLDVNSNEIVAIFGPNGCGKTTLFNSISGLLKLQSGKIIFNDIEISKLKPYQIANLGISRTFQDSRGIFEKLSILDSTILSEQRNGYKDDEKFGLFKDLFNFKLRRYIKNKALDKLYRFLPNFDYDKMCTELSGGEESKLKICSVFSKSKLILLDEPTAGVDEETKIEIIKFIKELSKNVAILIIEHDMEFIKKCADRIIYMKEGCFLYSDFEKN